MAKGKNVQDKDLKKLSVLALSNRKKVYYYSLPELEASGIGKISRLPFSLRIVLESLLRNLDAVEITNEDVIALANWNAKDPADRDIHFKISRILMQDFTGVPAVVDLAAMREFLARNKKSADLIQPTIPVDLVIDHSVQVDSFNSVSSLAINQEKEIGRNAERYRLLKWGSQAFKNFRVLPPSAGICHQVNLEYISTCVTMQKGKEGYLAFPDTLVGTDSHTTMINGLGVVGFGVGGIEAEAALLGQAVSFATPKVLGVNLTGKLQEGVTATDFALTLTRLLREKGVVNMFVEFFGDGLKELSLPDRATLSNMCPEYGATIAIFPIDGETLKYMRSTGRSEEQLELIEKYYRAQRMFGMDYAGIEYSDILDVKLDDIVPSVSGPSQPKQQMPLSEVKNNFEKVYMVGDKAEDHKISHADYVRLSTESLAVEGNKKEENPHHEIRSIKIRYDDGYEATLSDGDVVIASITSCTNTSNPSVVVGAGLLAKKALERGLSVDTRKVKTSLGPGSRVVMRYLENAGLVDPLAKLGFGLVGFGCITCIGNSGPLIDKQSEAINKNNLVVASVLSGNRNYESRIHNDVSANYLMSPPLLVAFAIAGTVLRDLSREPLAKDREGKDVYLKDIWPSQQEINEVLGESVNAEMFAKEYGSGLRDVNPYWDRLESPAGKIYKWGNSTYILQPPFFEGMDASAKAVLPTINGARVLAVLGDSVSTDHISPAGAISIESPAGRYLLSEGVKPLDFNTYGSRRGNHEVMMRGTFSNNRIRNLMLNDVEGGYTKHLPEGKIMLIYDAAMKYKQENVPLIVIAGTEYGSGSSRDWAAKGPMLLGVKAIIAKGFERIHRSNLIGMGILPLQFKDGEDVNTLHIDYTKPISVEIPATLEPKQGITIRYTKMGETAVSTAVMTSRLDTPIELEYYKAGGVLNYVLKKIMNYKEGILEHLKKMIK